MKVQPISMVVLAMAVSSATAQTPAPAPQPPQSPRAAAPADAPPTPPPTYVYAVDARRDPFVSLLSRGDDLTASGKTSRPDGLGGVLVNEVVVRGILQSQGGWVAMVGAPNGKTYTVRPGDRLMDGRVRSITAQALILLQEVNDPLSVEKQREVRKYLRGGEEVQ